MHIEIKDLEKRDNGWMVCVKITLDGEEQARFSPSRLESEEDYRIYYEDKTLYFSRYFDKSEPWEDEPLDELIEGIKGEIIYKVNHMLK